MSNKKFVVDHYSRKFRENPEIFDLSSSSEILWIIRICDLPFYFRIILCCSKYIYCRCYHGCIYKCQYKQSWLKYYSQSEYWSISFHWSLNIYFTSPLCQTFLTTYFFIRFNSDSTNWDNIVQYDVVVSLAK